MACQVFLRDTDERACAYIAGAAPNRWGFTSDGRDLNTLIEPVPPSLSGKISQNRVMFPMITNKFPGSLYKDCIKFKFNAL